MHIYLRHNLAKSRNYKAGAPNVGKLTASQLARGSQRGGSYVARTQIGYEKDGSPQYRYFRSEEEYEAYLKKHGKSKHADDLEEKLDKEQRESSEKAKKKISDKKDVDDTSMGLKALKGNSKAKTGKESHSKADSGEAKKSLVLFVMKDN